MDARELGEEIPGRVPGLLRYARTLTRDEDAAEDLVQETIVKALARADSFRGSSSPATWLHTILRNTFLDQTRRPREVFVGDLVEDVEQRWRDHTYTVDAEAVVARAETRAELLDALARLPMIYQVAVLLHDAEGMTMADIAEIEGIGLPAAKQRLRRGRMMLVSSLARGHERRTALRSVPMRCWDARSKVSDYLDGEVTRSEAVRLEKHLAVCPTCPPLYRSLVAARDGMAGTPDLQDPDSVVPAQLAARISLVLSGSGE